MTPASGATALLIGFAVVLSGCVSSVPLTGPGAASDATFVNDQAIVHCDQPAMGGFLQGGALALKAYADCKTEAERQGFVRTNPQSGPGTPSGWSDRAPLPGGLPTYGAPPQ